jgi:ribosomal protein S18 acetylase RimI-like enzyme
MYELRCLAEGDSFELDGAPAVDAAYRRLVQGGATRPEWCHVLRRGGVDIGRVGFRVAATCPPELLGRLPAREVFPVGLWLRWDELDWLEAGRFLIERAFEGIRREVPEVLQAIIHQRDERASERRRLFEACGMQLFQEKQGYGWRSGDAPPADQSRLTLLTLERAGRDRFRDALGRAGENTLDRNDRFYREHAGEANWANVLLTLHEPAGAGSWLLALDEKGRDVGVVAVSRFGAPGLGDRTATITFIGVVPEQRGKGYVGDLLRAANEGALRAGFDSMLSDTDVLNTPMASAFVRNGHRADICTWHKWHYRMPR